MKSIPFYSHSLLTADLGHLSVTGERMCTEYWLTASEKRG